jgi:pimeloyl-ACP methyl ester carboxylesterase
MRKFFIPGKTTLSRSFLLWLVIFALIGDFNSLFSEYSSRQKSGQVPYGHKTKFWIYTPPEYSKEKSPYPLLVSLHGGSAIGNNLNMLFEETHENPPQLIHINKWFDLPLVVLSPQLRRDPSVPHYNEQNWPPDLVDEVIEYVKKEYNIDPDRIYVTGISLGSAGTWNYAAAYPDKVAAILPLGGQAPKDKACQVKDLPIWTFHGENDVFVPTRFTRQMMSAIDSCSPKGKYIPHANISLSMQHEVWDQVYNGKGGYDVYRWMLSFNRKDTANHAPFVFTGRDRKMKLEKGPFYLTAEYFDVDGTVDSIRWSQTDNGSPMLKLENTNSRFLKVVDAAEPGVYTFRLMATDNDGASSFDEVSINLLPEHEDIAVVRLTLTDAAGKQVFGDLQNDQVFHLSKLGNKLNIHATVDGFNVRMRWGVNSDQATREVNRWAPRFWKDYAPFYIRGTDEGPVKSGWTVSEGDYLVCATALGNRLFGEPREGTCLCRKITFTK